MRAGGWILAMMLWSAPLVAAEQAATVLYYRMSEPGVEPYLSRWLITTDFMRIDEGSDDDNYILFDRHGRTVYSVVHGDRTVLDIPPNPINKQSPLKLEIESRVVRDEKMPAIGGERPLQRDLYVNDSYCDSVISVEKLLPDAARAMGEYRQVMAGEHAKNMDKTPLELQQPCELALHIFSARWIVERGLPVQEWDPLGRGMSLLDYKAAERVDAGLFTLPQGYRHYQTGGVPE